MVRLSRQAHQLYTIYLTSITVPFRFRGNRQGPTRKHENTWSALSENASTKKSIVLATGTQSADITDATATEVKSGAHVKWIYFEFHFSAETITTTKVIHWWVAMKPFGTSLNNPNQYQLPGRRFIIKRGMEMLPKDVSTVFKRVFVVKIPRKFQRLAIADQMVFEYIASSAETINACGIAVYRAEGD